MNLIVSHHLFVSSQQRGCHNDVGNMVRHSEHGTIPCRARDAYEATYSPFLIVFLCILETYIEKVHYGCAWICRGQYCRFDG